MNTRLLVLPLALGAMLFALGCSISDETLPISGAAVPDDKPKADGLPTAPPPHVKKTTAELLVGTWKVVEMDDQQVPQTWTFTLEFTRKGELIIHINDQKNPLRVKTGTYKLMDKTIRRTTISELDGLESTRDLTIKTLSEDELTIVLATVPERERMVLKRVVKK